MLFDAAKVLCMHSHVFVMLSPQTVLEISVSTNKLFPYEHSDIYTFAQPGDCEPRVKNIFVTVR